MTKRSTIAFTDQVAAIDPRTALTAAAATENGAAIENAPRYAAAAFHIARLFDDGNHSEIHAYLCEAQDACVNGVAAKRTIQGIRDTLPKLPTALVLTAARDYRVGNRNKNPLFRVEAEAEVKAAKASAEAEAEAEAVQLEAEAAQRKAEAKAEAEASLTAADLSEGLAAEADRLGISLVDVVKQLINDHLNQSDRLHVADQIAMIEEKAVSKAILG